MLEETAMGGQFLGGNTTGGAGDYGSFNIPTEIRVSQMSKRNANSSVARFSPFSRQSWQSNTLGVSYEI